MSRVVLRPQELQALLSSPQGPVFNEIRRRGNLVLNNAVRLVPVDEGRLKGSLTLEMSVEDGLPIARVGSNLDYAIYVHEGTGLWSKTRPGPIRPVNAKILRWPGKNNTGKGRRRYKGGATANYVYARQSAGSPPRPFLTEALKAAGGIRRI